MRTLRRSSANLLLLMALVASYPSYASSIDELDLPTLTKKSSKVVTGEVVDQVSRWDANHRYILTYSKIRVEEVVRGEAKSFETVTVVQPGGSIDDTTQVAHGMQLLRVNDRLLLFLDNANKGPLHKITGSAQGVYRLNRDPHSGVMMATPPSAPGLTIHTKGVAGKTSGAESRQALPIDELKDQIRKVQ